LAFAKDGQARTQGVESLYFTPAEKRKQSGSRAFPLVGHSNEAFGLLWRFRARGIITRTKMQPRREQSAFRFAQSRAAQFFRIIDAQAATAPPD